MAQSPAQGPYNYAASIEITAGDTAAQFSESQYSRTPEGGGRQIARYCLIQILNNHMAWAHDTTLLGTVAHGYYGATYSTIELVGEDAITGFAWRNWANGSNALLVVTMGY